MPAEMPIGESVPIAKNGTIHRIYTCGSTWLIIENVIARHLKEVSAGKYGGPYETMVSLENSVVQRRCRCRTSGSLCCGQSRLRTTTSESCSFCGLLIRDRIGQRGTEGHHGYGNWNLRR